MAGINWTDLLTALIGLAGGTIVAWIGLRGRKTEVSTSFNDNLLQRQDNRIGKLETRIDVVEQRLRETEDQLRLEEDKTYSLRRALVNAVDWLREFVDWARGGAVGNAPEPDIVSLTEVLSGSHAPRSLNPPSGDSE